MSASPNVPISRAPPQHAIHNQYLVRIKEHCDLESHLSWLELQIAKSNDESFKCEVIHRFDRIKGYSATLNESVLQYLTKRDDVKSITEDRQASW